MPEDRVIVVGAGIGGLTATLTLAAAGIDVTVVEQASEPGGKMREIEVAGRRLDAGPTVLTLRPIFEDIFASAGLELSAEVTLTSAEVLARHAWTAGGQLDLFADRARSADAIGAFSGPAAARGYLAFSAHARRIYDVLDPLFIHAAKPSPFGMVRSAAVHYLPAVELFSVYSVMAMVLIVRPKGLFSTAEARRI